MRTFPVFVGLFFLVPLVEIFFLVKIGGEIGAGWTVLLVISTAILGAYLLRQQGLATFGRFQQNVMAGNTPAIEVLEGIILLVGGLLLMVPGFFTDVIGFLCLIPVTRQALAKRFLVNSSGGFSMHSAKKQDNVFEGEFTRQSDERLDHH